MISEIQIILKDIQDHQKSGSVQTMFLHRILDRHVIFRVDWNRTYDLAIKLGLIKEIKKDTELTENGLTFESMKVSSDIVTDSTAVFPMWKLSPQQKRFIFKKCILGNDNFKNINQFLMNVKFTDDNVLELFTEDMKTKKIRLTTIDRQILSELGIAVEQRGKPSWKITEEFSAYVQNNQMGVGNDLTDDELDEIKKEQKEIGKRAEKFAKIYEEKYLAEKGWTEQVKKFNDINSPEKIVATKKIGIGYDLSSFLKKDSQNPDKNIEVKGRKRREKSFYMSRNEILKGQKYSKDKNKEHWIYFYYDLGKHEKSSYLEPTKKILFKDSSAFWKISYSILPIDAVFHLSSQKASEAFNEDRLELVNM